MSKILELELKMAEFQQELEALKLSAKEEEFKVGDWVTMTDNYCGLLTEGCVYQILKRQSEGEKYWILDHERSGQKSSYLAPKESQFRKATLEEIETHLISEAEKKGFVKGAKVKVTKKTDDGYLKATEGATEKILGLFNDEGQIHKFTLFNNKLYATLCSTAINAVSLECLELIPSHPQITVNGYTAEFKEDRVKFGCAEIDKNLFIDFIEFAKKGYRNNGNKYITSVTIGSGTFTFGQIEEIAKHYSV
jgi:hypothetical protein